MPWCTQNTKDFAEVVSEHDAGTRAGFLNGEYDKEGVKLASREQPPAKNKHHVQGPSSRAR